MIQNVVIVNLEAIKKAYYKLKPGKILDVGGGDQPIKKATHVIDIQSYEKRGRTCKAMGLVKEEEKFTKKTWTQLNICDYPWPFKDKEFDFVWCTQTLEDIRDPIGVCKEMMRVGKAGYINCPAKISELVCGMNQEPLAEFYNGFWHHRWLVSLEGNKLIFEPKNAYATSVKWADQKLLDVVNKNPRLGYVELFWKNEIKTEERFGLESKEAFDDIKKFVDGIRNG